MKIIHKTRGQHPQPWNHVEHVDSDIMTAEVCASTTERMRPEVLVVDDQDMEDMILEEQNEIMREPVVTELASAEIMESEEQNAYMRDTIALERSLAELIAIGGEPIRVRPRATTTAGMNSEATL
eukprot:11489782-Heterocapsa_arctica.AAC.1